jgi:hypothetical protein
MVFCTVTWIVLILCLESNLLTSFEVGCWYGSMSISKSFVVCVWGTEVFQDFLQHLTNLHLNIKFLMDADQHTILPCLDVPIKRSVMAHWVTLFTENHLGQSLIMQHKNKPLSTPCHARTICKADSLKQEGTTVLKIYETPPNSRHQKGDMKQVSC